MAEKQEVFYFCLQEGPDLPILEGTLTHFSRGRRDASPNQGKTLAIGIELVTKLGISKERGKERTAGGGKGH